MQVSATVSARQAHRSALPWLARAGLTARGVIYVLIGALAVQIAFGSAGHQADRSGALRLVGSTPVGSAALWLLAAGFAGMCLWRASQAIWGSPGQDGKKATTSASPAGARSERPPLPRRASARGWFRWGAR